MDTGARKRLEELLRPAGVTVGGENPWDVTVHNDALYARFFAEGTLGVGESYMDGWWDCPRIDELFHRILCAEIDQKLKPWRELPLVFKAKFTNIQRRSRAFEVGRQHYDVGNDLYARMLDSRMIYSCAYWAQAETLDEAQEAKLDLVCQKLGLEPGMRVLDVGCGWGGAARFAAERYGVEVVGITVSKEQARFARESCAGVPVEIRLQDYRDIDGMYDRVFSLGMIEHVGRKNYRNFLRIVRDHLVEDGLFLLQTVGSIVSVTYQNRWINKYIFPNSMPPSIAQLSRAAERLFVVEDWHNFGADYDRTVMAWHSNFEAHWDSLKANYDGRFYRMWRFYLLTCAGYLRARKRNLWQIVFSPKGVAGGYRAPQRSKREESPSRPKSYVTE